MSKPCQRWCAASLNPWPQCPWDRGEVCMPCRENRIGACFAVFFLLVIVGAAYWMLYA